MNNAVEIRITPACAGNRRFFMIYLEQLWDHPRLRGEQKKNGDSGEPLKDHPRLRGEQFEFYIQVL